MENKNAALLLPMRSVIFLLIFVTGSALTGKAPDSISNWWSVAATIVNVFTVLLIVLYARRNGTSYRSMINYQPGKTTVREAVKVSLIILLIGMGGMFLAGIVCYRKFPYTPPMMIAPIPKWLAIVNIPLLPVTTALAEEGLYLGCGVNSIKNRRFAVIVPAFFFALQHSFIPALPDARYMIYRFISFLPLTLILCSYYYRKRDPIPIMIGHALINAATVMQILATSMIPGFYDKMCELS